MIPNVALWATLIVGAVAFGASLVAILVARRALEPFFAVAGLVSFLAAAWAFGELGIVYDRFDVLLWAIGFGVAAFCGGYALASTLLANVASRQGRLIPPTLVPDDCGKAALILLGDVDPETYNERLTAADLDRLSNEGLLSVSIAILPFLFFAQKARYRAVGGMSPASRQLALLAERVAGVLRDTLVDRVEPAWLEGESDLAARVLSLVAQGYRSIAVDQVMIAESLELDEAKRRVDALRLAERGITVRYADALWSAERVAALVAARALSLASELSDTGVIVVGAGQPVERSQTCRDFDEHELSFMNRVRMLLIERGIPETNVRLAWADWHGPDVTSTVRHVAALGCRRLVVAPAGYPLDTIATLLDLQVSVRQSRVDDTISVVTAAAWHDDPLLVEELRARAIALLDDTNAG